tara:strand:+ start:1367 stop:1708 length:342 start_codon:yes stop_codon:yes gene_type:complete
MTNQNGYPGFSSSWWTEILKEYEPAQYYSSPAGMSFGQGSPRRRRYFSNAYEDIFKDYLGATGTAMRGGQEPVSFMNFLETDPWTARYTSLPQAARGVTGLAANPRTRFLYNF